MSSRSPIFHSYCVEMKVFYKQKLFTFILKIKADTTFLEQSEPPTTFGGARANKNGLSAAREKHS